MHNRIEDTNGRQNRSLCHARGSTSLFSDNIRVHPVSPKVNPLTDTTKDLKKSISLSKSMNFGKIRLLYVALNERGIGPDLTSSKIELNYDLFSGYSIIKRYCSYEPDLRNEDIEYLAQQNLIEIKSPEQIVADHGILPEDIPTLYDRLGVIKLGSIEVLAKKRHDRIELYQYQIEQLNRKLGGIRRFFSRQSTITRIRTKLTEKEVELSHERAEFEREKSNLEDRLSRLSGRIIDLDEEGLKLKIAEVGKYFRSNGVYFGLTPNISKVFASIESEINLLLGYHVEKICDCDFKYLYPNWSWIGNKEALISIQNASKKLDIAPEEIVQICEALNNDLVYAGIEYKYGLYQKTEVNGRWWYSPKYSFSPDTIPMIYITPSFVQRARKLSSFLNQKEKRMAISKIDGKLIDSAELEASPADKYWWEDLVKRPYSFPKTGGRVYKPMSWEVVEILLDRLFKNSVNLQSVEAFARVTNPYDATKSYSLNLLTLSKKSSRKEIFGTRQYLRYIKGEIRDYAFDAEKTKIRENWELTEREFELRFESLT